MTARLDLVPDGADDEQLLVHRAVAGDEHAFEQLYHRHSGRVFALCLRLSASRQAATELTQDVFVHLWEHLHQFRGESALSSWIHRMTVNLVLGAKRTTRRRERFEVEDADPGADAGAAVSRPTERAAARPRSVEDAIDLERAIAALPPGAREVFVLHDVEGYKHGEIAGLTGTAEGTCRAQLHRARRLLMEALDK